MMMPMILVRMITESRLASEGFVFVLFVPIILVFPNCKKEIDVLHKRSACAPGRFPLHSLILTIPAKMRKNGIKQGRDNPILLCEEDAEVPQILPLPCEKKAALIITAKRRKKA